MERNGWREGVMDGQIDGQMDGRTDGWMGGWISWLTETPPTPPVGWVYITFSSTHWAYVTLSPV